MDTLSILMLIIIGLAAILFMTLWTAFIFLGTTWPKTLKWLAVVIAYSTIALLIGNAAL